MKKKKRDRLLAVILDCLRAEGNVGKRAQLVLLGEDLLTGQYKKFKYKSVVETINRIKSGERCPPSNCEVPLALSKAPEDECLPSISLRDQPANEGS